MQVSSIKSKINKIKKSTDRGDVPYEMSVLNQNIKIFEAANPNEMRFGTKP